MKNKFKRIISCVSFLGLFLMSFLGLEAKAVTASNVTEVSNSAVSMQNSSKPFILYSGIELTNKDNVKLAGHYSHRSHYSHSSHSSHYSSRF